MANNLEQEQYKSKYTGSEIDGLLDFVNNNQNNLATLQDIPTVPSKTSDLTNDNEFITNTVNNLLNYYLKTEVYSKTEAYAKTEVYAKTETYTKAEIGALISASASGGFIKVNELPTENINDKAIYLVPYTVSKTGNLYEEYIYVDNAWEMIGTTKLDLSNYVTTEDLSTALSDYVTSTALNTALADYLTSASFNAQIANYYNKTEITGLLAGKVDNDKIGAANGVASLGNDGKVPSSQLPEQSASGSGANNVVEGYRNPTNGLFYEEAAYTTAITGAANTLYVDLVTVGDAKDIYRWDGTGFVLENTRSQDIAYDDYQALSESEKNNGTTYYIPDATAASEMLVVGNKFDKANIYTATEKMIGSWMGKPLYQKCYVYNTAIEVNTSAVIVSPSELTNKIVVGIDGYCVVNATAHFPLNIASTSTTITTRHNDNGIQLDNKWGIISYVLAIIQYTKTTDGTIKIGTENDYSTDEMIVGTWIDGKPIYQKTISGNILNSSSYVTTLLTNVDKLIKESGQVLYANGGTYIWYSLPRTAAIECNLNNNAHELNLVCTTPNFYNYDVTLQYTKTTD